MKILRAVLVAFLLILATLRADAFMTENKMMINRRLLSEPTYPGPSNTETSGGGDGELNTGYNNHGSPSGTENHHCYDTDHRTSNMRCNRNK
ncbi:conserved hypothetical protein [Ricinus communis]|uniref:Uncharacterized protein n=1 Tax=Ricinus communis TaxID=3988 RepID=B9RZS7_RICCO|nr:conserved hypothetical protein [Ricinus communis]